MKSKTLFYRVNYEIINNNYLDHVCQNMHMNKKKLVYLINFSKTNELL